jgi:hypothetical protein
LAEEAPQEKQATDTEAGVIAEKEKEPTPEAQPQAPHVEPPETTEEKRETAVPSPSAIPEASVSLIVPPTTLPPTVIQAFGEKKEALATANIIPAPPQPQIVIPPVCWRGIFADFRSAHAGTTEAPDEFLFGSLLAAAGSVLGRCCYVQTGQRLYPNFYVDLVGETAKSRKTTAARKATDLVESVDPDVARCFGLSTAEGLMLMFQESEAEAPVAPSWEGQRVLVWIDEFSGLLKKAKQDYSAPLIEMLQRFYDNPDRIEIRTKIAPMSARKPSLSLLTATTREKLSRHLSSEDIEGGFANRFSYFAGIRKPPIPRPSIYDEKHLTGTVVVALHKARNKWKDEKFSLAPEAIPVWDDFYNKEYYAQSPETIAELTNRLPDQAMKLSLIYAATENDKSVIHRDQMEAAVAWAIEYEKPVVSSLFADYGVSEQVKLERRMLQEASNGRITKREHQRRFPHTPAKLYNDTLNNLLKAGKMETYTQTPIGKDGKKRAQIFLKATT